MKQLDYGEIRDEITFVTSTLVVCAYTSNGCRVNFYLDHLFHYGQTNPVNLGNTTAHKNNNSRQHKARLVEGIR
jgi:hypothetical protein